MISKAQYNRVRKCVWYSRLPLQTHSPPLSSLFHAQDSTLYGLCAPLASFWIWLMEGSKRRLEGGRTVKSGYLLLQLPLCGLPWVNAVRCPAYKATLPLKDLTIGKSRYCILCLLVSLNSASLLQSPWIRLSPNNLVWMYHLFPILVGIASLNII